MARSLAFYRRLGVDIPADVGAEDHVEAPLPGGLRMAWDTAESVRSFDPTWSPPTGGSRIGLAFACDDPAMVDRVYATLWALATKGISSRGMRSGGQRYASVRDPDGNGVDLFAPLAGS